MGYYSTLNPLAKRHRMGGQKTPYPGQKTPYNTTELFYRCSHHYGYFVSFVLKSDRKRSTARHHISFSLGDRVELQESSISLATGDERSLLSLWRLELP